MSEQLFWYTTRSAGVMTWIMSMASIVLGLLLSSRALGRRPTYPWLLDLHRFVSGLSLVFMALHMATLWADDYVHFGLVELFVPGKSSTQTDAVSYGVIAAWLLIAIQLSSLLRRHIPNSIWRGIHLGAYVAAIMGTIHGLKAGSDVRSPVAITITVACWALIVGLTAVRLRSLGSGRSRSRPNNAQGKPV